MDTITMDKNINDQENCKDTRIVIDEADREKTKDITSCIAFVVCFLSCIGIGIMCIVVALEQNESDENNMIYLEGQIVYVFYLGVCILFCVGICLFGALCAKCCGDFSFICVH